jgi:hypothetical protein
MKKAFLSHSSADKANYVQRVASRLGPQKCIIDELCFEEGMKNMEEIIRNMEVSDLFVVFLSTSALESDWVTSELCLAKNYTDTSILDRIYPIIIESGLRHDNPLFVDKGLKWLVDDYNLQYIARPAKAERRITQRLIELTWAETPLLKENKLYFSGRNDLIDKIEERFDDYDLSYPVAVIASGLPSIGRRSLLAHTFRKKNLYMDSYSPNSIYLSGRQGIDDFILGLNDLSITQEIPAKNLLSKNLDEKLSDIKITLGELSSNKDIVLIIDDGSIILNNGEISEWFEKILENQYGNNRILFQVVSRFRLNKRGAINRHKPYLFAIDVPELNEKDRKGLFKKILEQNQFPLSSEQFSKISVYLKGLPEEIFFAIELINEKGVDFLMQHLGMIADFRSEKISKIIKTVRENEKDFCLLNLLSHLPYFSLELLLSIEPDETYTGNTIEKFLSWNIIEYLGARDYMRINDAISDYINRLHIELKESYKNCITKLANEYIKGTQLDTTDLSKFYFLTKELLYTGKELPNEYIIPSILLNTIADTYEHKKDFQKVILLSDRILNNSEIKDKNILRETRYWLCLALARERDSDRFYAELKDLGRGEYNFLLGFYHRLMGNLDVAIDYINKSLDESPNFKRAKSELVNAYIAKEDYVSALDMAKENYESIKNNPFNIHNYLRCLIITKSDEKELIEKLLEELDTIKTDKAIEMYLLTKARYLSIKHDISSFDLLKQALHQYKDSYYPILAALEIAERFKNIQLLKEYIKRLENIVVNKRWLKDSLNKWKQRLKDMQ